MGSTDIVFVITNKYITRAQNYIQKKEHTHTYIHARVQWATWICSCIMYECANKLENQNSINPYYMSLKHLVHRLKAPYVCILWRIYILYTHKHSYIFILFRLNTFVHNPDGLWRYKVLVEDINFIYTCIIYSWGFIPFIAHILFFSIYEFP